MSARPSKVPRFADSQSNEVEPSQSYRDTGFVANSIVYSAYENFRARLLGEFAQYVNDGVWQGPTTGTTTTTAATPANTFTRSAGSFLEDGFAPGMRVQWSGFAFGGNNALVTITNVTALVMTVAETLGSNEAGTGNEVCTARIWIKSDTDVTGSLAVDGDLDVTGDAAVDGDLDVTTNLTVGGSTEVADLTVNNGITMATGQHITLVGGGRLQHGDRILNIPPGAGFASTGTCAPDYQKVSLLTGTWVVPVPLIENYQIKAVTFARFGDGAADFDVSLFKTTPGGTTTDVPPGPVTVSNAAAAWNDTTIDWTDTAVLSGNVFCLVFIPAATGISIGNIRLTYASL